MPNPAKDGPDSSFLPYIPFRFSIKTLLILMTVVAVVLGLGTFSTSLISFLLVSLIRVLIVPSLLIVVVFARGTIQTFAIGSLITAVLATRRGLSLWDTIWLVIMAIASGMVAIVVRRWIELNGWDQSN